MSNWLSVAGPRRRAAVMTTGAVALAAALGLGVRPAAAAPPQGPVGKPNRLVHETSPYLLQHAYNPVDWYAWGPEAFEAARRADKPIFLSIGYSTCYWCHVMERESFENHETAKVMNEHFISIKLDREERPDVDAIYMSAINTLAGRGGWPMSVFLEPDTLKPFAGGTYFPPEPRYGKPSFRQLLISTSQRWRNQRPAVLEKANQVAAGVIRRLSATSRPQPIGAGEVDRAVAGLMSNYDATHGGFRRGRPKFPQPVQLELLLGAAWDQPAVRDALVHTLDRMAMGGIYDQIGGGFHRYSTDQRWLVPHFEKMLYDNAQLASVYAKAYERTGDAFYESVLRGILDYVLREMTSPEGPFYSAQDAEVNAREGASYVWTPQEIGRALEERGLADQIDFALTVYGATAGGNFVDPHHRAEPRKNVLYLARRPEASARAMGMAPDAFRERLTIVNEALLAARDEREQPRTDDKVLTAWNGLMISAMVDGAQALGDPAYLDAAERAARFILEKMRGEGGGLLRTYRAGRAKIEAFSVDYALFVKGLIALYRATGSPEWLDRATELNWIAGQRFRDGGFGSYYDTLADQDDIFVRSRTTRDGVVPCANSVMLANLLDLYEVTDDSGFLGEAAATLAALSGRIRTNPGSTVLATLALNRFLERHPDLVPGGSAVAAAGRDPVEVVVSTRTLRVSPDTPGRFNVTLRIAKGYHVNAHEPGLPELIGLRVQLIAKGFELDAAYPPGQAFSAGQFDGEIRVHSGQVTVPVTVRQTATDAQGEPKLLLTYQVCTDEVCLKPQQILLPVKVVSDPGNR